MSEAQRGKGTEAQRLRLLAEPKVGNAFSSHHHLMITLLVETFDAAADRCVETNHFLGDIIVPAELADAVRQLINEAHVVGPEIWDQK